MSCICSDGELLTVSSSQIILNLPQKIYNHPSKMSLTQLSKRKLACLACFYFLFQSCSGGSNYRRGRVGIDLPVEENESSLALSDRQSKNLFPFVWVTFQPSPCGTDNVGVCVQRGKCSKRGGMANGSCRDGFGECCNFMAECNENKTQIDVDQLVTRLKSPMTTSTTANGQQCSFRFKKEPNICQVKLEFTSFTSMSANPDGFCEVDKLKISGSVTVENDFTTCGDLRGQNMYLTFGSQDTIDITPIMRSTGSRYDILATMIPCDSPKRAPDHCLQYYTASTGRVMSLDFGRQQQNNQRYTACVKPIARSSGVKWTPCAATTTRSVYIVSNFGATAAVCDRDWFQVKGENKVCENFTQITSSWKPYDLLVNFDETEFPAASPTFTKPITGPCDATPITGNCFPDGILMCGCLATEPAPMTCQCTLDYTSIVGAAPAADLNNTGFCLEYSQL